MPEEYDRTEQAMVVYEDLRLVTEQLRDIDLELDAEEFQDIDATERAKEHLEVVFDELERLGEILQAMHKRPEEDSSDGVLDAG